MPADLAIRRHAPDASRRLTFARTAACALQESAVFCAKARALPDR